MYAIIQLGGRQERVEKGGSFTVNRMPQKEGNTAKLSQVLFAKKGNAYLIGTPYIKGASVECEVVKHTRGDKVVAFKYKKRKSSKHKKGHRQEETVLKVKDIHL